MKRMNLRSSCLMAMDEWRILKSLIQYTSLTWLLIGVMVTFYFCYLHSPCILCPLYFQQMVNCYACSCYRGTFFANLCNWEAHIISGWLGSQRILLYFQLFSHCIYANWVYCKTFLWVKFLVKRYSLKGHACDICLSDVLLIMKNVITVYVTRQS